MAQAAAAQVPYVDPNDPAFQAPQPTGLSALALKLAAAADAGDGGDRYQKLLQQQYAPAIVRGQMLRAQQYSQNINQENADANSQFGGLGALVQGNVAAPGTATPASLASTVQPPSDAGIDLTGMQSGLAQAAQTATPAPVNQAAPLVNNSSVAPASAVNPSSADDPVAALLGPALAARAQGAAPPQPLPVAATGSAPVASAAPAAAPNPGGLTPAQALAARANTVSQIKQMLYQANNRNLMGDGDGALALRQQAAALQNAMIGAQNATGADALVGATQPTGLASTQLARIQPAILKAGETQELGNGQSVTAPVMGVTADGSGYTQTPTATTATGTLPVIKDVAPGASLSVVNAGGPNGPTVNGQPSAAGAPNAVSSPAAPGAGAALFKNFVLPHEGGYNPSDMNGSPTNFGINQKANPGVDVKNLTPDQAAQIFNDKYYIPSGAPNLPPALAAVHADTYFINPLKAQQFLKQSGGDPNAYLALRQQWMNKMVQTNPAAAKYAKAWGNRNADLAGLIQQDQGAGSPTASVAGGGPSITPLVQGRGYSTNPQTGVVTSPTGEPTAGPTFTKPVGLQEMMGNEDYKQTQAALAAYKAMTANAGKMTGPAAYTMLDTMARAINPGAVARPTVIQTIESHIGLPAKLVGSLDNAFGNGPLPISTQQQILDATYPFIQAHYQQASAANAANRAVAVRHGFNPDDYTAPLEALPKPYKIPTGGNQNSVTLPQVRTQADYDALPSGAHFLTPDGKAKTKR